MMTDVIQSRGSTPVGEPVVDDEFFSILSGVTGNCSPSPGNLPPFLRKGQSIKKVRHLANLNFENRLRSFQPQKL